MLRCAIGMLRAKDETVLMVPVHMYTHLAKSRATHYDSRVHARPFRKNLNPVKSALLLRSACIALNELGRHFAIPGLRAWASTLCGLVALKNAPCARYFGTSSACNLLIDQREMWGNLRVRALIWPRREVSLAALTQPGYARSITASVTTSCMDSRLGSERITHGEPG